MRNSNSKIFMPYLSSFLLYELLCYLANAMIMPSMLEVIRYLHAPQTSISITVIAYMIGLTVTPLFVSPIANYFGKSKVIIVGSCIFSIANLICPFSHNIIVFTIFRLFQGIGQGFIFLGYTMIHEAFDDVSAVKLTSLMGNITVIAPLIGPLFGSLIAISLGWKYVFWITGLFALLAVFGLVKWQPVSKYSSTKFNFDTLLKRYKLILLHKRFILGCLILSMIMAPSELWMIFSVLIVINSLKLTLFEYNIYMIIIIGASILSSLVLRRIINLFTFSKLTYIGSSIYLCGAFLSILTNHYSTIFIVFIGLAVFGGGLFRGVIFRLLITGIHEDKNTVSALFNLIVSGFFVILIYFSNFIFIHTNFSLISFGLLALIFSFICLFLARYFISTDAIAEIY